MRVGSLFSGAGCGDLGLEWAGFEHAWFCESDEYARKVLALRWPGVPIYGDIRDVDFTAVPHVDVLAGGFPCQDISVAGKGAGISGSRSGLWSEYARAIGDIRPRYALIENSPPLITRGLDVVLSDLAALGYDAEWHCIPASAFGARHKRDRVWIVAHTQRTQEHSEHEGRQRLGELQRRSIEAWGEAARQEDGEACPDLFGRCSKNISNPMRTGREELHTTPISTGQRFDSGSSVADRGATWWATEPQLGRVAHGTPHRVDRLRCIGNGQVPHCTYFIGRCIMSHAVRAAEG